MSEKTHNKIARKKVLSNTASVDTDLFLMYLRQTFPHTRVVKEYRFHDIRKWRFDYAFPDQRVAVEVDGAVWSQGRHNRPVGYIADMEKLNTAASMGWLVLRITTDDRFLISTRELIKATLKYSAEHSVDAINGRDLIMARPINKEDGYEKH